MARFVSLRAACLALFLFAGGSALAKDAEVQETLLLQEPAVSAKHVVFVHGQDLWVVGREGGTARRLTSHIGREAHPRISPDGTQVAFSGEYDGNSDVYVMPIDGGAPRRITWHPGTDYLRDWHPDGKSLLILSGRDSGPPVYRLFTVSASGGNPEPLAVPRAAHATYSATGDRIAYTPISDAFRSWKRYRGGRVPPVWIYDPKTHDVEEVPHDVASDTFPCFLGKDVYFASDRKDDRGLMQMNIWRYTPGSGAAPTQITKFTDFGVRNMSAGGGVLAFTMGGAIRIYDPKDRSFTRLEIRVPSDEIARLPRWDNVRGAVRSGSLAPNGKRAVFEARGEIITMPREHGAERNLTDSPGVHDRSPTWSPDGKQVAWFSDAGGEYQLVVRDRLGREEPRSYGLRGAGFYEDPVWSPDGKHILFNDKGNRLAYVTLADGEVTDVHTSQGTLGRFRPFGVWSTDSKWIAFETISAATSYTGIALYELESGTLTPITDGFSAAASPAFSRDGKHLFFQASVDEGPRRFGLDLGTSTVRAGSSNIYVVVLKKDGEHPLGPRSDEAVEPKKDEPKKGKPTDDKKDDEKKDEEKKDEGKGAKADDDEPDADKEDDAKEPKGGEDADEKAEEGEAKKKEDEPKKAPSIDTEGISQRILALPLGSGNYRGLACTASSLIYLASPREGGRADLKSFDFKSRKENVLVGGAAEASVSADGKNLLVRTGGSWQITDERGKSGNGVNIDAVRVQVDPAQEWPQLLRECWRLQRDFFYDPQMHGVDWPAMWERWSAFLPHVHHRADLNIVMMEMIGELCCGHEYVSGGDYPKGGGGIDVGLLGADTRVEDGHHRITRIYQGQNWNPGLRAPLTEPGVLVNEGDFILAVDGRPLRGADNFFAAFQGTANEPVELTVCATTSGEDKRTVTVVPLGDDDSLRRMAWVEGNRKRVDELSGGRLAYAYMPNTAGAGLAAFDRDFYSQLHKEGLVLDERYNGGGKVADYIVDVLGRDVICYWMNREGWLARTPFGTLQGPKVMVINERAGSGGDAMPWMFKKLGIGPLVGTRTWGGLVGISGYPPLMDGGSVTAASFGIMDTDGRWVVENEGVAPDHEVIEWPKDIAAGRDPQLEKAVEVALELLEKSPAPVRPGYSPPTKR
ncbi:MAG: PDZ domain-containing protein [Planctomycetota bacterium]|nr:PDZ domain-containing protein [Planctomycetota bacterium]